MKKLKIILYIFLISLFSFVFFTSNVNASTIEIPVHYSQNVITKLDTYSLLLDNAIQYLKDNATTLDNLNSNLNLSNDSNVVGFDLTYDNTLTSPLSVYIYYSIGNLIYNSDYNYYSINTIYYQIDLNFDSNYNITGYANQGIRNSSINMDPSRNTDGSLYRNFYLDYRLGKNSSLSFSNSTRNNATFLIGPIDNQYTFIKGDNITFYDFAQKLDFALIPNPSYTINQEILPNGNVKLLFNFTNYVEGGDYGFTITNKVNGEEYGIPNPYTSIFPNIIPFGNSYEIILDYDTVITVSLSKYTLIEGTQLYDREPLFVDSYDINNVVFDNIAQPYFSVLFQNKSNIIGVFNNTDNTMSCYYKFSNSSIENQLNCNSSVNLDFPNNGFIEFIIKKQNNVIYSRKINILGGSETEPYIIYNIEKQDFYTKVNWYVQNYNNQLKFRYSLDNGLNFSNWALLSTNQQFLNVFENSVVIIEISDNSESTIYDSKAINVIVSIENLKNFNNTTNNLIDKFNNIFSVNSNILANIELMWNTIKTSKIYLFVFIPFITSIICAIIYLIRR